MNTERIRALLNRFYEGTTTPAEERLLAEFFRGADVPQEWESDRQLFLQLSEIADAPMPDDIAEEIAAFVSRLPSAPEQTHAAPSARPLRRATDRVKTPPKYRSRIAAAVALLLAFGGTVLTYRQSTDPYRDTCANAQEAAIQIRRANEIINRSLAPLSQALPQAVQMSEYIETIQK